MGVIIRQLDQEILIHYSGFTHFITLSLKQTLTVQNTLGATSLIRGDDVIYQNTYEGFIRSLSKNMTSKHAWKRRKFSLPNIGSIEGNGEQKRFHLHVCVQKPLNIPELIFQRHIISAAYGNPWIEKSDHAVNIAILATKEDAVRAIRYSLKHGLDRVLIA